MRVSGAIVAAVAIPRLALLPINENRFGDAISRTEMAERWMAHPHVMTAFGDGAGQYGPLQLYLVGLFTAVADRELAGRLVSLIAGILTVIPLFRLGHRLGGPQNGVVACLVLAVWGLHIQFSTTAASEAVGLLFMLSAIDAFSSSLVPGNRHHLAWAAVWLNLAAAVRYDAWLYPPVVALATFLTCRDARLTAGQVLGFLAACSVFPVLWMLGNYHMHGDPTYPLTYINGEHRRWADTFAGFWPQVWLRVQGIAFWPALALVSLTPGIALLGLIGMVSAWRERSEVRWVIIVAAAPIVYYGLRTTVFADFVPLTRFMVVSLALMLPFVRQGYLTFSKHLSAIRARWLVVATVALAIAMPATIGAITFRRDGVVLDVLRPISPTSTNPRPVMAAAGFLRTEAVPAGRTILVDTDRSYFDLPLVFYSGLRQEDVLRVRGEADLRRIMLEQPTYIVRFDKGDLLRLAGVRVAGSTLQVGEVPYDELTGFEPPVHIYRRRP